MSDISSMEMFQYLVGEVTKVRADEIDAHLAACRPCQTQLDKLNGIIRLMDEPDEDLENVDLAARVNTMIGERGGSRGRKLPAAIGFAAALVVAVAVAAIWMMSQRVDDSFRIKSSGALIPEQDRWVSLRVYRLSESGQTAGLSDSLDEDDFLLFAYSNLGERPKRYLMIFAVDSQGEVYWFYPAFKDAESDPAALPIDGSVAGVELPEKIRHRYAPGQLWIYGLFTDEPMSVSAVERLVGSMRPGDRIPIGESAQHILTTVVGP